MYCFILKETEFTSLLKCSSFTGKVSGQRYVFRLQREPVADLNHESILRIEFIK